MRSGGERLGLDMPYPERLAFPTEDSFGMAIACHILLRSLDGGRNAATIQFETMRKLQAHYSNFHHTLPGGTGLSTIAEGRGSSTFTGSPTYSYWFRRFMTGCHRRMGDTWIPDRAITLEEILHSYILLEEDWKRFAGEDLPLGSPASDQRRTPRAILVDKFFPPTHPVLVERTCKSGTLVV